MQKLCSFPGLERADKFAGQISPVLLYINSLGQAVRVFVLSL